MIIAIDIRPLLGGNISGVEVYIQELLKHLFKRDTTNQYILYLNAAKKERKLFEKFQQENVTIVHTRYPNKIFNAFLVFLRWPKIDRLIQKKSGSLPDVLLLPDIRPAPLSQSVKKITVVHDLAYHHFPEFFSWRTRTWYALIQPRKELRESHKIITPSKFTQQDLIKTYHTDPSKISVIPEGIREDFCTSAPTNVQKKYDLPENFFLFLSTLEPRKNIHRLIEAFTEFKKNDTQDTKLVIAGKANRKIFSKTHTQKNRDIIFTGFIEEKDKPSLYTQAEAFIYPSLFEGFGLPLLEAMKCTTPIIASRKSSIPEVVGSAAILIDPEQKKEITKAMHQILKPEIRKDLQTKMAEQIQKFSWEKCAKETLALF